MDYELLVNNEISPKLFSLYIKEIIEKSTIEKNIFLNYKEYTDYVGIACEYFAMFFDFDEYTGLDIIFEEYQFKASIGIIIQLYKNKFKEGLDLLFIIMKNIADHTNNDILFLENGSIIVLEKRGDTFYTGIDESWETEYPFGVLNRKIQLL